MEILHDIIKSLRLTIDLSIVRVQYKRLFKYDPQCWMPVLRVMLFAATPISLQVFLYFDTKSWTLIAYCALMLSIVNLRIKVDVTISCLLFLHERVIPMQS